MQKFGCHHIALKVASFDKAYKFYTETLGFKSFLEWGEGDKRAAMLDIGDGVCVELFAGGKDDMPEGAFIHLAIKVEDTDAAYALALSGGAKPSIEPKDVTISGTWDYPVRIAFVIAPTGETLEFFHAK